MTKFKVRDETQEEYARNLQSVITLAFMTKELALQLHGLYLMRPGCRYVRLNFYGIGPVIVTCGDPRSSHGASPMTYAYTMNGTPVGNITGAIQSYAEAVAPALRAKVLLDASLSFTATDAPTVSFEEDVYG